MGRLDDEIKDIHPVLVRRLDFLKEPQRAKQPLAEFYASLCTQGDETDLPAMNHEDFYDMRLIAGAHNPKLHKKFPRESAPTLELLRIACEHKRSHMAEKVIDWNKAVTHNNSAT